MSDVPRALAPLPGPALRPRTRPRPGAPWLRGSTPSPLASTLQADVLVEDMVHQVAVDAPHAGLDQALAGVDVEGDHRQLLQQECLRLPHQPVAFLLAPGGGGQPLDDCVVA